MAFDRIGARMSMVARQRRREFHGTNGIASIPGRNAAKEPGRPLRLTSGAAVPATPQVPGG
jgi:hypothetical protein